MTNEKKIVFDTNFLLVPYHYRIDIFSEVASLTSSDYKFVIPSSVINELIAISKKKSKDGLAAKLALKIIEVRKKEIEIIPTRLAADKWIVEFAKGENAIICTNDKKLKKQIKRLGRSIITLRSKSKIELE
jgi:rRNA-processing protein FCF1